MFTWSTSPVAFEWLEALAPAMALLAFGLGVAPALKTARTWCRVVVVAVVAVVAVRYQVWRISQLLAPNGGGWFPWTIYAVEVLALAEAAIAMLLLSRTVDRSGEADVAERRMAERGYPKVDVYIPTYNEGIEVLEKTIVGALALDWPKDRVKVWVLDDGKREWLKDFCLKKGAGYLTRPDNSHAKAGNINAAFPRTDGEFIAVFDADFVPQRNYLKRTVGLFEDPKVGCVQTPHHFYNSDPVQANLLLDGMLPDDQRMFFDVIMPSRDAWNAAFCCGSCGVLRRTAVEAIGGGIPTESVTEDILTTLAMKRAGFVTRFLNEKLAFGLAAESVAAFFVQRERWGRGGIQLMFLKNGPFGPGLGLIDRLLFFPASWLVQYLIRVVGFLLPALCLWVGASPMPLADTLEVVGYQAPFLLAFFVMMRWMAPRHQIPFLTSASQCFASFRMAPSMLASLAKPFGTPFRVTPKGKAAGGSNFDARTFWMASVMLAATVTGVMSNLGGHSAGNNFAVLAFWAFWNCATLGIVMLICFETPRRRAEERVNVKEVVELRDSQWVWQANALDYSLSGARIDLVGEFRDMDAVVVLNVAEVGELACEVVGRHGAQVRLKFIHVSDDARDRLIVKLFASGRHEVGLRQVDTTAILSAFWTRAFGRTWLEAVGRRAEAISGLRGKQGRLKLVEGEAVKVESSNSGVREAA